MWPAIPPGRPRRYSAARAARCSRGCIVADGAWRSCWPRRGGGMGSRHRMLAAFVAGDLGMADARRWDEHLLECERCWRAVREDGDARRAAERLRLPPPPGLADQVRFAVELAAAAGTSPCPPGRRRGSPTWVRLAVGGAAGGAFLVGGAGFG